MTAESSKRLEHDAAPKAPHLAAAPPAPRAAGAASPAPEPDEPTLAQYVWTLVEGWRVLVGVAAVGVVGGVAYLLAAAPVYHSDAVVQVEARTRGANAFEDILRPGGLTPAESEIALIRSRSALGEIVEDLGLDIEAGVRRFPLVGGLFARRHRGPAPAAAPPGLGSYGWGGERLRLRRLEVPSELLELPLRLVAGEGGRYRLSTEDGALVAEGVAGQLTAAGTGDQAVSVLVAELVARPGTQFNVRRRRRTEVVADLQKALRVVEEGRLSGVLVISLDGPDPARTAAIVEAVTMSYARQNVERRSAEAAQQLAFLESQLPIVKETVRTTEESLNSFLKTHRSVNLSREAQSLVERGAAVERELSSLELQASELRQRFTVNHPAFTSLNEKLHVLRGERAGINARLQEMPEAEANSAKLQRDLRVATQLYDLLLTKSQELRIAKSGTVGNVRVVDHALQPDRPAWPKPRPVLLLSTLLGIFGGIGAAFARRALWEGASDPEEIEASTGLPVLSAIPHSRREAAHTRRGRARARPGALASSDPSDDAYENLLSLRTSLQFALVEARNNVVAISGPSPEVGKSFVAANLARVLATGERRVLLIDADLRRGRLHQLFGVERGPGLADVLCGAAPPAAAVRPTAHAGLDVMTTGSLPPNAAELLGTPRFQALLEGAARSYACVVVDTPPVLAVTDATVVARLAGVNLLVLRQGRHSMREIAQCVKRFDRNGAAVNGAVLNDVRATFGRYGKHGRNRRYAYEPVRP